MSEECSINILLDVEFSENNISNILQKGFELGFKYHFWDTTDQKNPFLNAQDAAKKFLKIMNLPAEEGPACVSTVFYEHSDLDRFSNFVLFFYRDTYDRLEFHIGAFGSDCNRIEHRIDMIHYIPLFLGLCRDFVVMEVQAKLYVD